jgi:acetyl-CoA carboxylase biotin carboxyl carrier protein
MPSLADQIRFLSRCLEGTDIERLELTSEHGVLCLRRDGVGQTAADAVAAPLEIEAPSVGVFRRAHPLQTAALAQPGQRVTQGDPVGVLQVGALLIHVVSPANGTVLEVLAEDGAAVGYGTSLVRMVKDGE